MENYENMPLSQIYQQAAEAWVDLEAAADLLENMKSLVMAQRQAALGSDVAINRAEQIVKTSPQWMEYVQKVAAARKAANLAKVKLEQIRMRFGEWNNLQANARAEMKML